MLNQIIASIFLILFYTMYIGKNILQKRKSINTNQLGKGENKDKKLVLFEIVLMIFSYFIILVQILSIFIINSYYNLTTQIVGVICCILSVICFYFSLKTMKDNWRAGVCDDDSLNLVTNGIYKISRNPAFLAFYLMYIGILLLFFNIYLFVVTVITIALFHIQILQEEKFLSTFFKDDYIKYKKTVNRYIGRRKY